MRLHSSRSRSTAVRRSRSRLSSDRSRYRAQARSTDFLGRRRRSLRPGPRQLGAGRASMVPPLPMAATVPRPLILEDLLDALDGEALLIEQVPDALEQQHVLGPIVAPAAAALERLDAREARLPEAQHVLRQIELFSGFGDRAEGVGRFFQPESLRRKSYFPARTIDLLILDFNTLLGLNTRT